MGRSVNKIILVGNVGRDPDVRETQNGTKVAHLSLATNRRLPGNGEEVKERTDWHRLTFWNRLAQFAEDYIGTGDRIYVEGRPGVRLLRARRRHDTNGRRQRA